MPDPRQSLLLRAKSQGRSLAQLSTMLGRNSAYLQQYIQRHSPRSLPEDDRRKLAICLNVDERELGARDPWSPPSTNAVAK